MTTTQPLVYTGTSLTGKPVTISRTDSRTNVAIDETIYPYIPSPELVNAVNLALLLDRPLLVMGEPGCGKSKLAQAIAYELYQGQPDSTNKPLDYRDFYQEWFVKSTSKAQEGLYEFDAIRRLADAQIARTKEERDNINKRRYWSLRPMGYAFQGSIKDNRRVVLLIDEIDKADLDFPNDLLNELDNARFTIGETEEPIVARYKPIVIITSNAEKDLPDAFLRRCLYHYIDFDEAKLKEIIVSRFHTDTSEQKPDKATEDFIDLAKTAFLAIRRRIEAEKLKLGNKNVSTSEFLDWYKALNHYRTTHLASSDPNDQKAIEQLISDLELVIKDEKSTQYPFAQALFKNYSSWLSFVKPASV